MSGKNKAFELAEAIRERLKTIEDPEFEVDIVNLGLIYDIEIDGGRAQITMTLTSMGCPTAGLIESRVKREAAAVEGIDEVEVEFTFSPPWTPELITEEGRDFLESMGYL